MRTDRSSRRRGRSPRALPSTTTPYTRPSQTSTRVDDDAVLEVDVAEQRDPATHHLLEQRPGHAEHGSPPVALGAVPAGLVHPGAGAVDPDRAQGLELVVDAGEPADQQVQAGGQQQVQVPPLGHVPTRRGASVSRSRSSTTTSSTWSESTRAVSSPATLAPTTVADVIPRV